MQIAIAADHGGFPLKGELKKALAELGHGVEDLGTHDSSSCDYPDYALPLTQAIVGRRAELGVLLCGTGIGMSIAANKVPGIRAALCHTEFEARVAREHNDANVLCLGARVLGPSLARAVLEAFLTARFEGGRHAARLGKISGA